MGLLYQLQADVPGADVVGLEKQAHHVLNYPADLTLLAVVNGHGVAAMRRVL